jgi:hypothetical protein
MTYSNTLLRFISNRSTTDSARRVNFNNSKLRCSFGCRHILCAKVTQLVLVAIDVIETEVSALAFTSSVQHSAFDVSSTIGIFVVLVDAFSSSAVD